MRLTESVVHGEQRSVHGEHQCVLGRHTDALAPTVRKEFEPLLNRLTHEVGDLHGKARILKKTLGLR